MPTARRLVRAFAILALIWVAVYGDAQTSRRQTKASSSSVTSTKPGVTDVSTGPTLDVTNDFIKQTIAQYGSTVLTDSSTQNEGKVTGNDISWTTEQWAASEQDSCNVSLTRSTTVKDQHEIMGVEVGMPTTVTALTYRVALSSIDPASLAVTDASVQSTFGNQHITRKQAETSFAVLFTASNNAKVISASGPTSSETVSSVTLHIGTREMADRLAKALSHAVTLCGGKASAF